MQSLKRRFLLEEVQKGKEFLFELDLVIKNYVKSRFLGK